MTTTARRENNFLLCDNSLTTCSTLAGDINAKNGQSKNHHSFSGIDFPQKVKPKDFTVGKIFSVDMFLF